MSFPVWLLLPSYTSLLLAWENTSRFELYMLRSFYRNYLISSCLTMGSMWVFSLLGRFFSCFSFPVLIMQMPVHPCLFVLECFSSYSVGWREGSPSRRHLWCGGSLLTDAPWRRRKRCGREMSAICSWFRPGLGVILMCLLCLPSWCLRKYQNVLLHGWLLS